MSLLREIVERNVTAYHECFGGWEEAVRASCQPLIKQGYITDAYEQAIVDCVKKFGPYIVLAPNIAMPHSTISADGVNEGAIGFMKVEVPVSFEEGNAERDARLFFVLAATDPEEHMANMSRLANILTNPQIVDELLEARTDEDLLAIDARYPDEGEG